MKEFLKKLPIPISGLMLGLAALGNLLASYSTSLRYILGGISGLIFILLVLKFIYFPNCIKEGLDNPVIGSIMGTFPMGMMILTTYIKPFIGNISLYLWVVAIILHIMLIIVFTKKYIVSFSINKVFTSYFIVYVGIVVASVTAPVYQMQNIGQIIFWFGFITYLMLLPIVLYRVLVIKNIPEVVAPVFVIFAAPASLCTAGYLNSFSEKNNLILVFLCTLSVLMLIYVLSRLPKLLKLKFYPSYAAFTFPLVISAIAITGLFNFLTKKSIVIPGLSIFKDLLVLLAFVVVIYVLIRYIVFLFKPNGNASKLNAK